MSWQAVSAAKKHRVGSAAWKSVLLVIADHCNPSGSGCTAHYSTIADEAECGIATVKRAIPAMLSAGVLHGQPGDLAVEMTEEITVPTGVSTTPNRYHSDTARPARAVSPRSRPVSPRSRTGITVIPPSEPTQNRPITNSRAISKKPGAASPPRAANRPRAANKDRPGAEEHDFARFWAAFPCRVGKGQARKAWIRALTKADADTIVAGAERYRDDPTRKTDFTAHPTTWLNGERWTDEAARPPRPETFELNGAIVDARAMGW